MGVAGFINLGPNNPEVFIPSHNEQIGGKYGVLKALTPSNGTVRWQFNTSVTLLGSVAIIPGAVLFGDVEGNLYAVSTGSGASTVPCDSSRKHRRRHQRCRGPCLCAHVFWFGNSGALYAYG